MAYSVRNNGTIFVWDAASATLLEQFPSAAGEPLLAWSPDGRARAAGYTDGSLRLWDWTTGHLRQTWQGHDQPVNGLQWSPDGKLLVSSAAQNEANVQFWDSLTGKLLGSLECRDKLSGLAWSPDSKWLATAAGVGDGGVKIWEAAGKRLRQHLRGEAAERAAWSPDSKALASVGNSGQVALWKLETGKSTHTLEPAQLDATGVAWSPDGDKLAVMQPQNPGAGVQLVQAATGVPLTFFAGNLCSFTFWSPDSRRLTASSHAEEFSTYDMLTGKVVVTCRSAGVGIQKVAASPDGKWIAAHGGGGLKDGVPEPHVVFVWGADNQQVRRLSRRPQAFSRLGWAPDSTKVVTYGEGQTHSFDVASDKAE